jgi:hypothetical protein
MKTFLAIVSIVTALSFAVPNNSLASRPVPKTITGCVINGILHSSDGYEMGVRNLDLAPYEGKRIQVKGNLLPGDSFLAETESLKVLGNCVKKLR